MSEVFRKNVSPTVWGPLAWKLLYAIAHGYSDRPSADEKQALQDLFSSLKFLLPCASCRVNLGRELEAMPVQTDSARAASESVAKLQNSVSVRLGKPAWTLNTALSHYKLHGASSMAACGVRQDLKRDAWEPDTWLFLTAVAYAYPETATAHEQDTLRQFFKALAVLMPHESFRADLAKQLQLRPLDPTTCARREELCDWLAALKTGMASSPESVEFEHMVQALNAAAAAAVAKPKKTTGTGGGGLGGVEIALIVIVCVALLALAITLYILLKKKKQPSLRK